MQNVHMIQLRIKRKTDKMWIDLCCWAREFRNKHQLSIHQFLIMVDLENLSYYKQCLSDTTFKQYPSNEHIFRQKLQTFREQYEMGEKVSVPALSVKEQLESLSDEFVYQNATVFEYININIHFFDEMEVHLIVYAECPEQLESIQSSFRQFLFERMKWNMEVKIVKFYQKWRCSSLNTSNQ